MTHSRAICLFISTRSRTGLRHGKQIYNEMNNVSSYCYRDIPITCIIKGQFKNMFKMKNWHFHVLYILGLNIMIFSNILYLTPVCTKEHEYPGMEKPVNIP